MDKLKPKNIGIINILFIGDVVGRPGRRVLRENLSEIKKKEEIDFVIANGENLAAGKGITLLKYKEMIEVGIDYFTSGNHIWNNEDIIPSLDQKSIKILRPANYATKMPGRGFAEIEVKNQKLLIINLQGRVFMKDEVDDPFVIGKNIIDEHKDDIKIIDFHAEATSEKVALGYYFDGMAAAVLGTHTHVQTSDERILPNGTAYISDIGMTGPIDSVLGVKKEIIIEKFLTALPLSHKVATGDAIFNAVVVAIDTKTKLALDIKRISKIFPAESF